MATMKKLIVSALVVPQFEHAQGVGGRGKVIKIKLVSTERVETAFNTLHIIRKFKCLP